MWLRVFAIRAVFVSLFVSALAGAQSTKPAQLNSQPMPAIDPSSAPGQAIDQIFKLKLTPGEQFSLNCPTGFAPAQDPYSLSGPGILFCTAIDDKNQVRAIRAVLAGRKLIASSSLVLRHSPEEGCTRKFFYSFFKFSPKETAYYESLQNGVQEISSPGSVQALHVNIADVPLGVKISFHCNKYSDSPAEITLNFKSAYNNLRLIEGGAMGPPFFLWHEPTVDESLAKATQQVQEAEPIVKKMGELAQRIFQDNAEFALDRTALEARHAATKSAIAERAKLLTERKTGRINRSLFGNGNFRAVLANRNGYVSIPIAVDGSYHFRFPRDIPYAKLFLVDELGLFRGVARISAIEGSFDITAETTAFDLVVGLFDLKGDHDFSYLPGALARRGIKLDCIESVAKSISPLLATRSTNEIYYMPQPNREIRGCINIVLNSKPSLVDSPEDASNLRSVVEHLEPKVDWKEPARKRMAKGGHPCFEAGDHCVSNLAELWGDPAICNKSSNPKICKESFELKARNRKAVLE